MSDPYEGVMQLVAQAQAEQKANTQIATTKIKDLAQQQQDAAEQQLQATGQAALLKVKDAKEVATGVQAVTSQLKADPNDPTSLLARNNVAMALLNEKLLANFDAIDQVQNDHSVMGSLQQIVSLPSLQRGVTQITAMHDELSNASAKIETRLNNQTANIQNSVKLNDTQLAIAESNAAAAETRMKIAREGLVTAKDLYAIQESSSESTIRTSLAVAQAKQEALMAPLHRAIAEKQLAQFAEEETANKMLQDTLGLDNMKFAAVNKLLKSDPMTYNAVVHFAISKQFYNPQDAELVGRWMNKNNLTYKVDTPLSNGTTALAGSPMPVLAAVQEATRPGIAARVESTMQGYIAEQRTKQVPETQINKVLQTPSLLKTELASYTEKHFGKDAQIPSDAITMNPAHTLAQIPGLAARVPLIQDIVNTLQDKTQDISFDALMNLMVKQNMNVPADKIADQASTYAQEVLAYDKGRPVYDMLGMPKPNSVTLTVPRMSVTQRFFNKGVTPGLTPAGQVPLNPLNKAELTDYFREIKSHTELNIPNKEGK